MLSWIFAAPVCALLASGDITRVEINGEALSWGKSRLITLHNGDVQPEDRKGRLLVELYERATGHGTKKAPAAVQVILDDEVTMQTTRDALFTLGQANVECILVADD